MKLRIESVILSMSGAVGNADRMNQRRVRVWHSAGRVRRKTAPTGPREHSIIQILLKFIKKSVCVSLWYECFSDVCSECF